jgi:hypothetical protein
MARIGLSNSGAGPALGSAGDAAAGALEHHARAHGRGLAILARAGYAAKGVIYLVVGSLAVLAATGSGGGTTDTRGALRVIGENGGGRALLLLMGVGLLGFALWSLIAAALDAEDRGRDAKGIALRIGRAVRGLAYGLLGVEALRIVANLSTSSGDGAEHWSARALAMPWGRWLVVAAGLGVIAYAIYQFFRGARKNLRKRLRLIEAPAVDRWVIKVARFGIIARGVVFLMIGWLLVRAGWNRQPDQAGGIDESLNALAQNSWGPIVLGLVAVGLVAYGIWELVNAKYRHIPVA